MNGITLGCYNFNPIEKMDKMKLFLVSVSTFITILSFVLTPGYTMDITLTWDTDFEVDGYKLYYKAGSSGPPYNGTGAAEGDSPVDMGWISEFTLRAFSDYEDYYIVITAYNQNGESGYSNEVTTAQSEAVATNSVVAGDGGSGGGCFISTIIGEQ